MGLNKLSFGFNDVWWVIAKSPRLYVKCESGWDVWLGFCSVLRKLACSVWRQQPQHDSGRAHIRCWNPPHSRLHCPAVTSNSSGMCTITASSHCLVQTSAPLLHSSSPYWGRPLTFFKQLVISNDEPFPFRVSCFLCRICESCCDI